MTEVCPQERGTALPVLEGCGQTFHQRQGSGSSPRPFPPPSCSAGSRKKPHFGLEFERREGPFCPVPRTGLQENNKGETSNQKGIITGPEEPLLAASWAGLSTKRSFLLWA